MDDSKGTEEQPEDENLRFGWIDILAMIIAAYQVLFPMLLAMVGTLLLAYLLFRLYFRT